MAGGFPGGFVGMKTCKRVTEESDFLSGLDETESSSLESSLASPRAESVPAKIPAGIWAVAQVTELFLSKCRFMGRWTQKRGEEVPKKWGDGPKNCWF